MAGWTTSVVVEMKPCTGCRELLPLSEFRKKSCNKSGVASQCVPCSRAYSLAHYRANPERGRIYRRKWNANNPGYSAEWARRNPESRAKTWTRYYEHAKYAKYGLDKASFDALAKAQGGKCAICKETLEFRDGRTNIDHSHATGKVRGLLCRLCNVALGALRDSPGFCEAAAKYIRENA